MGSDPRASVTKLLQAWRQGDEKAVDRLVPLVYGELVVLARGYMGRERPGHTLQPTALVHEAFLKLAGADVPWRDRAHFMAVAAQTMRRILVDHARARKRVKRGRKWVRQTLDEGLVLGGGAQPDIVKLDTVLNELASRDRRAARAAELHYFGGMSYKDTAVVLDVSPATVQRDLRFAKAWLYQQLAS